MTSTTQHVANTTQPSIECLQVFELSETHEQKNLSGNSGSSGSQTLHSTVSVSGESHEDGGRISSEGLPQLQFQSDQNANTAPAMECVQADDDLVRLTRRVGVSHTANWLGVCSDALGTMLVAHHALCGGRTIPSGFSVSAVLVGLTGKNFPQCT